MLFLLCINVAGCTERDTVVGFLSSVILVIYYIETAKLMFKAINTVWQPSDSSLMSSKILVKFFTRARGRKNCNF